jgi:hypothetical protein
MRPLYLNFATLQQSQLHWDERLLQHPVHLECQQQVKWVFRYKLVLMKKTRLIGNE